MKVEAMIFGMSLYFLANPCMADQATKTKLSANKVNTNIAIQSIDYKIFDRQTGKLIGHKETPSDPYGMHNDVYVEVKLKGKLNGESVPYSVILTATTPKTSDEARGDLKATSQSMTRDSVFLTEQGAVTTVPFLLKFECNPMTIKVEVPELKILKQVTAKFSCAE